MLEKALGRPPQWGWGNPVWFCLPWRREPVPCARAEKDSCGEVFYQEDLLLCIYRVGLLTYLCE